MQVTGTKREYEQSEHLDAGETVMLQGAEAAKFTQYKEVQEFREALGKVLESNDPHVNEVMRVTTQSDPEKVAEYISQHQTELSPTLLDFLRRSLRIKTSG